MRRLYEYTLYAVTSPFYLAKSREKTDQLALHTAKLFNVNIDEHEQKFMQAIKKEACDVVLFVDVKQARNLLGEDQNGLSDPYCEINVISNPSGFESANLTSTVSSSTIISASPSTVRKRSSSLFSCVRSSSPNERLKPQSRELSRQNSKASSRRLSGNRLLLESLKISKTSANTVYRTSVQIATVNPEWNEHFEFEVENVLDKYLLIEVYDSDHDRIPGLKTVVQEKRGFRRKLRGIREFLKTGQIKDDFLGLIQLDIKSLAAFDRDQWFPLIGLNQNQSDTNRLRGEILLGLKVHFKLDEKSTKMRQRLSNTTALEFRRGYSAVRGGPTASSIIFRSSIFRKNFRSGNLPVHEKAKQILQDDFGANLSRCDSCLTPATDTDSPLLIEEYHQLNRIVMLHELEDARDTNKGQPDDIVIDWSGAVNQLSVDVMSQFRVLYNISILSDTLIQLLVIMELRCSDDYAMFISQGVIEGFSKPFLDQLQLRADVTDLDFTDYEKTVFNDTFYTFIDHYKKRVNNDAPWFLPAKENLANIQSIFDLIRKLLELKICSNELTIRNFIEETIKSRIKTDINDSFSVHSFSVDDQKDISLVIVNEYLQYVKKIAESMTCIREYSKLFALFNINYIKECYFGPNGAGDRLTEITRCLLTSMKDYFHALSKPIVTAKSSIYDRNWIEGSTSLLNLYLYLKTIVVSLQENLSTRDWEISAFKLRLNEYREWFSPFMIYLLEGFVANIRQAMERAAEYENDIVPEDFTALHSGKAMGATSLCIKLCQEWEQVDYPDINVRYTALIKLTNTMCEQCQHYARRIARKLSDNEYFTDLNRTGSFNVSKKLCTLVNDIEYVKSNLLSSLPRLLNFSTVIDKLIENYQSEEFRRTKATLERLITTAENEMNDVIEIIFEHVAKSFYESLRGKICTYYQNEKRKKPNSIQAINQYIDQEILQRLHEGLEKVQYSRVASAIRLKALQCFKELFPQPAPPDFYKRILISFDQLSEYFEEVCREKHNIPGPACEEEKVFREMLRKYALSTEELELLYFVAITQAPVLHDHSSSHGEIVFRTAYEVVTDLITIHVCILNCRNLPKMDVIGLSDPYVVVELLPETYFQNRAKSFKTDVHKRTLNPEYNKTFQWHRLPQNILKTPGTVLHLSVWDEDRFVKDDFIGECFVPLGNIQPLGNRSALRDMPVSEVYLRKPHKNIQPPIFELIRSRTSFDTEAAKFVKERSRVMGKGTGSEEGSTISEDRNSSGSYAGAAIRSLFSMMHFPNGLGFNFGFHDQSTVDDDNDDDDDDDDDELI